MPRDASTAYALDDLARSQDAPRREPIPSLCPDLDDDSGLICAFRLSPLSSARREALNEGRDTPLWLHFNVTDSRARRWLRTQPDIPPAAQEALLGQHPRVHVHKLDQAQCFVAVLGDLNHDFDSDPANRSALLRAPDRLLSVDDTEHRRGLREALDRLDVVSQDLDLVLERARLLEEEIARRLSETTNRSLFVLSIVTTALLPITLITGVFGMNMGGLPWLDNPHGFERVLWMMAGAVTLALLLLNRSRLLKR